MMNIVLWGTLFSISSPAVAKDNIKINIPVAKNLIADFTACRDNSLINSNKIVILSEIIKAEKERADNLYIQSEKYEENITIVETQAEEWKQGYITCAEDLITCDEMPWWKIDFKSLSMGSILTLLAFIGI